LETLDLLIRGGQVFNAYFKKFIVADLVINVGRIFFVGKTGSLHYEYRKVIDAAGKYIIPGLIDIHMHIESSMTTPQAFAREVIRHGVTTIVSEPHEMANVFGIEGILAMIKAGEGTTVDIYYGIPSSVPSTSDALETTGAEIDIPEMVELARNPRVICLGEVMNCAALVEGQDTKTDRVVRFFKVNYPQFPIEGHCIKVSGVGLAKVLAAGITSDHTQQTVAGLAEKIQAGMFIELQEKSLTKENIAFVVANQLYEHIALVTDDVMADKLIRDGQLNHLVKKAIALGMPIENAIYCATYTPARRMNLGDRGSIAPGKLADVVILDDLAPFLINSVYKDGVEVFNAAQPGTRTETVFDFPAHFANSIKRRPIDPAALQIKVKQAGEAVKCRVIKVQDGTTNTDELITTVAVKDDCLDWENSPYCLIAVLERYGKNNRIGLGLITGDTIKRGAVAASYVHDHHNIIAVGKKAADIVTAVNTVIARQGGYFVVENGQVVAGIDLPIGGILSAKALESSGRELTEVTAAMHRLGYQHYNPVMSLSTNGLSVSPLLKITDRGLIRFDQKKLVDIVVEE
jgi:adenine deaminase